MSSKSTVCVTQMSCQLDENDLRIIHRPLITTEALDFDQKCLDTDYDLLVMTSKNSVKYFLPYMDSLKVKRIASIGKKTTEALADAGITVDFEPDVYTQEGFIEEINITPGEKILYPASLNKRPKLRDYMTDQGAIVTEIDLYYPKANTESVQWISNHLADIDFLTLSSPSAVEALMSGVEADALIDTTVIAIGAVTKERLDKYKVPAETPEHETLDHMITYIKERIRDEF